MLLRPIIITTNIMRGHRCGATILGGPDDLPLTFEGKRMAGLVNCLMWVAGLERFLQRQRATAGNQ